MILQFECVYLQIKGETLHACYKLLLLLAAHTCPLDKCQPSKVMTVENEGILAITRSSAVICSQLEVPNRQGNYPFSKFTS